MDLDTKTAEVLMEVLPWVAAEDRELMIEALNEKLGTEAGETVEHLYNIHRINKTAD